MYESHAPAQDESPGRPSLWHNRDYMNWWTGNTVSVLGTSVSTMAFPLLVLSTTGSVAAAGLVTTAGLLGTLVSTLGGGVLADRVSRRALMMIGPLVQMLALAVVVVAIRADVGGLALIVAATAVSGLASGLALGATVPALRRIVPKDQLAAATAQEMGRDAAANVVGAPLGGLLFAFASWIPFLVDAVSFLFAAAAARAIRTPLGPDRDVTAPRNGVLDDLSGGLRVVRTAPFLRFVVGWGAVLNAVAEGFTLLFIALVRHRGGGPAAVGVVSAVALIGAIIGAGLAPVLVGRIPAKRILKTAMWSFAAAFALVAFVPQVWEIALVLFLGLATVVPMNAVLESYTVRLVPDEYSGRVSSVVRFGGQSLQWTGPLVAGVLAGLFGIPAAIVMCAGACALLAVALHVTRALQVLDTPVAEVEELVVGATGSVSAPAPLVSASGSPRV